MTDRQLIISCATGLLAFGILIYGAVQGDAQAHEARMKELDNITKCIAQGDYE